MIQQNIDRRIRGRDTFTYRAGRISTGGASYEYNGYFKLVLETVKNTENPEAAPEYYVNIVDGATYKPGADPVSGGSVCTVNGWSFNIQPYRSNALTKTCTFALKYTAPVTAAPDNEFRGAKVEIVNLLDEGYSSLPSNTSKVCWYQLGRFIFSDGVAAIQQDHQAIASNGMPIIWWYAYCDE